MRREDNLSNDLMSTIIYSVISLILYTIVIYVVTKAFGEKECIGTAMIAALKAQ